MRSIRTLCLVSAALAGALATPGSARVGVLENPAEAKAGFIIKSDDGRFALGVGGMLEANFVYASLDEAYDTDDISTFQVRHARLVLGGNLSGAKNRFGIEIGADGADPYMSFNTRNRDFELLEGWMSHDLNENVTVRAGQFKTPFSRQLLTYASDLQLPERSLAANTLGPDSRDVGIELAATSTSRKLGLTVAVVNGEGRNQLSGLKSMAYYGRIQFDPSGDFGDAEGDVEMHENTVTTLGGAFHYQEFEIASGLEATVTRANFDAGLKANGWSLHGEFFWARTSPDAGEDETNNSFHLQGGRYFPGSELEVVARVSGLLFENDDDDAMEYTVGLNYFMKGRRLKWQAAYSLFDRNLADITDHRVIAGAEVRF